jgi:hypothetical protein
MPKQKSEGPENGSSLGEYARAIGDLDGERETKSENPAEDQDRCEGKEDEQPPTGHEPSSEGETS